TAEVLSHARRSRVTLDVFGRRYTSINVRCASNSDQNHYLATNRRGRHMSAPNFTLFDHLVRAGEQHRRHVEAYAEEDDAPTISPLVLSTMANNSLCSASGTLNFAIVSSKSLQKAIHSLSVILRCLCDSLMERPV